MCSGERMGREGGNAWLCLCDATVTTGPLCDDVRDRVVLEIVNNCGMRMSHEERGERNVPWESQAVFSNAKISKISC